MSNREPSIAFITSADGGLAHYVTQLWEPVSHYFTPYFITYAGKTVDDVVLSHVPRVERLVDFQRKESAEDVVRFVLDHCVRAVNLHIGTTAKRYAGYYVHLLGRLREAGVHVVETLHDVMPFATFSVDMNEVRDLFALADAYLVGNEPQLDTLFSHFDVGSRQVAIAPHGPYTLFDFKRHDRASARRLLALPSEAPVVLFFGRLRPDKSLECLLKAFPLLKERVPSVLLFISTDTAYTPQYNALLNDLKANGRPQGIIVNLQYVPSDMIEPIFKACDVLAAPYASVSQSGVLNLGKAFERPAVVTDIFAEADEINRHWGRAVPVGDAEALAEALAEVLLKPEEERRAMGAAALRLANERHSWEMNVAALLDVCRHVLTGC